MALTPEQRARALTLQAEKMRMKQSQPGTTLEYRTGMEATTPGSDALNYRPEMAVSSTQGETMQYRGQVVLPPRPSPAAAQTGGLTAEQRTAALRLQAEKRRQAQAIPVAPVTAPKEEGSFLGDMARAIVKPIAQLPIQFARTIGSSAASLAGNEEAAVRYARPVNVPFLGEVKTLGGPSTPSATGLTASPKETLGQAFDIASLAVSGGKGILGGLKAGAKTGLLAGVGEGLKNEKGTTRDLIASGVTGTLFGGVTGGLIPAVGKAVSSIKGTVAPDVFKSLKSAIKAPKNIQNFDEALQTAVKEVAPEATTITDLRSFKDALGKAKTRIWSEVKQGLSKAGKEPSVSLNKAADKIENLANSPIYQLGDEAEKTRLLAEAQKLRQVKLSPEDAEEILEVLNARESSYYKKNMTSRSQAERSDPMLAKDLAIADSIRGELDSLISGFGKLKKRWGQVSAVERAVSDRIPVAERQNITSLAEQISAARTAGNVLGSVATGNVGSAIGNLGDYAVATFAKGMEESDTKVAKAFSKLVKDQGKSFKIPENVKRKASSVAKPLLKAAKRAAEITAAKLPSRRD